MLAANTNIEWSAVEEKLSSNRPSPTAAGNAEDRRAEARRHVSAASYPLAAGIASVAVAPGELAHKKMLVVAPLNPRRRGRPVPASDPAGLRLRAETIHTSPPVEPWSLISPPMNAIAFPSGDHRGTAICNPCSGPVTSAGARISLRLTAQRLRIELRHPPVILPRRIGRHIRPGSSNPAAQSNS